MAGKIKEVLYIAPLQNIKQTIEKPNVDSSTHLQFSFKEEEPEISFSFLPAPSNPSSFKFIESIPTIAFALFVLISIGVILSSNKVPQKHMASFILPVDLTEDQNETENLISTELYTTSTIPIIHDPIPEVELTISNKSFFSSPFLKNEEKGLPIKTTHSPTVALKSSEVNTSKIAEPVAYFTGTTSTSSTRSVDKIIQAVSPVQSSTSSVSQHEMLIERVVEVPMIQPNSTSIENKLVRSDTKQAEKITPSSLITTAKSKPSEVYELAVVDEVENSESDLILQYKSIKKQAKSDNKLMMLRFTASWCVPCKMMENTTLKNAKVKNYLAKNFVNLAVDIDAFDGYNLKEKYQIKKVPAILIFNSNGDLIANYDKAFSSESMLEMMKLHHISSNVIQEKVEKKSLVKNVKDKNEVLNVLNKLEKRAY